MLYISIHPVNPLILNILIQTMAFVQTILKINIPKTQKIRVICVIDLICDSDNGIYY